MEQGGENSNPTPAPVLVDFPNRHLRLLNRIVNLVDPILQPLVADVLRTVPKNILLDILGTDPCSEIKVIECINKDNIRVRFGSYMKSQVTSEMLGGRKWEEIMRELPLRDQMDHNVCWAIVVTELIWALRKIQNRENAIYSPQELIDFVNPETRKMEDDRGHRCRTSKLTTGFEYVMKKALQTEEHRPFTGCPAEIPDYTPSPQLGYIKAYERIDTLQNALLHLKKHPIGAAVAMFSPEYRNIGSKIYRGPVNEKSTFRGMHAVSLMSLGKENGENYVLARASHGPNFGKDGYIKISVEVMLVYIPTPGEEEDSKVKSYFNKPRSLLDRFSYPTLLTKSEEEKRKKIDQDKMEID